MTARTTPSRIPAADQDELFRLAADLVSAGAPGAAVMVQDHDGVRRAASGLADIGSGRPMHPDLLFRAGSVTKSFVATVVLALVGEGRVGLSDTVERWLPGILPYGRQVTVRQLLTHTGGLPNNVESVWRTVYGSPRGRYRAWTPRELVALVADLPPISPPGTAWSYSNPGYSLLGLVVEGATGRTLGAELRRLIFEPLALDYTSYPVDQAEIPSPSSHGYSLPLSPELEVMDGQLLDFTVQDPSYAGAAGALISNLPDLCRFFRALLGGRLLPAPLLAEMLTMVPVPRESLPLPLFASSGMGVVQVEAPRGPLIGQAGGIPGFLNMILSTPDGAAQAGVMINVGDRAPDPVVEVFLRGIGELGATLLA